MPTGDLIIKCEKCNMSYYQQNGHECQAKAQTFYDGRAMAEAVPLTDSEQALIEEIAEMLSIPRCGSKRGMTTEIKRRIDILIAAAMPDEDT